jgi:hypothetical protein
MSVGEQNVAAHVGAGAVFGEPDVGYIDVVRSIEDLARGEVAGYNSKVVGKYRQLFPRISAKDYAALMASRAPEVEGAVQAIAAQLKSLDAEAKERFCRTRKVVFNDAGDGLAVVPRVPDAMDELDILAGELDSAIAEREAVHGASSGPEGSDDSPVKKKRRTYALSQVINDASVRDKYQLSARQVETAKRRIASDPAGAALLFQDMMNDVQDKVRVTVVAGEFSRDKSQAGLALREICAQYTSTQASVQSNVIGSELFMYGPGGEDDWHVKGPLKDAVNVAFVYWFAAAEGPELPSMALSMELVLLGIDVFTGVSYECPRFVYHTSSDDAPPPPVGLARTATELMTTSVRVGILALSDRLLPVQSLAGRQLSTAVRVTEKHVLVSSHVLESEPQCTVSGAAVKAKYQVARDVWACESEGAAEPWVMRDAQEGEFVVICYVSDGRVSCTPPLQLIKVAATVLVLSGSDAVQPGMSGGAVVSLVDLALLGVHSGSTQTNLIASRFGPDKFEEVVECDTVSTVSRQTEAGTLAERITIHLRKKGMEKTFNSTISSLAPVYVGPLHVGMAVHDSGRLLTTCDAEMPLRFRKEREAKVLSTVDGSGKVFFCEDAEVGRSSPSYRRKPNMFESVFVAGFDDEPYLSPETKVQHIGPNGAYFVLSDLPGVDKPVLGGLVMGWDGAVLGVCGNRSLATQAGVGYLCYPLPEVKHKVVEEPGDVIAGLYPFLNVEAWPPGLLEEVLYHSSMGAYPDGRVFNAGCKPLAAVGDAAARAELCRLLRELQVPHSDWQQRMAEFQSNKPLAAVAWKQGLARCIRVAPGSRLQKDSKSYADMVEALLGAVYLAEDAAVFRALCIAMGVVPKGRSSSDGDVPETPGEVHAGFVGLEVPDSQELG